ncbi:MAG TPA: DUF5655 domain-containing protein [Polyangia bacterium]|nr:DUF5655 domain-containing protein [Polyangia bacterium]
MPKTPGEMIEAVLRNLEKNTGRTQREWEALLAKSAVVGDRAQYEWLRQKHGLGHVAAKVLSGQLKPYDAPSELVDAQYSGERKKLRPIYEALLAAARKLGPDVKPMPCKTYVPLHRTKTFALIKPTTAARVDLGLCLPKKTRPAGRLAAAKNLGSDRVTHKIELSSPRDVDAEVLSWLKQAYEIA